MNKETMPKPAHHGEQWNASKWCTSCGAKVVEKTPCHRCGARSQVGSPTQIGCSTNYTKF
jgi:hypothetical protein